MDYAVHTMPSYQHLQGSASPAHMGSKNSAAHSGTGTVYMTGSFTGAHERIPTIPGQV